VGIVGYGSLGQYLVKAINEDPKAKQTLELAFVWNRTTQKILDDKENKIPPNLILEDLGTPNSASSPTKLLYDQTSSQKNKST